MVKVAPSILSADFSRLGEQVREAEEAGADMIHVDVMDGRFVPNITIGPVVVKWIRSCARLPLDLHLMIERPDKFARAFIEAGADDLTIHVEAPHDIGGTLRQIKDLGAKAGVVLNPSTPLDSAKPFIDKIDMLLLMTVNPGFAGQKFMPEVLPKIRNARQLIDREGLHVELEVDGGLSPDNARQVVDAGATIIVAGSSIFGGSVRERLRALRQSAEG